MLEVCQTAAHVARVANTGLYGTPYDNQFASHRSTLEEAVDRVMKGLPHDQVARLSRTLPENVGGDLRQALKSVAERILLGPEPGWLNAEKAVAFEVIP